MDAKRTEFDRLWNTDHKTKRERFRNLMKAKLDQIKVPFTEENARGYYLGEIRAPSTRETFEERRPREYRRPPRRR